MDRRVLGVTGIETSVLGLGTVKFGRNTGVKYPHGFDLPSDAQILALLDTARELGITLLDTAPAYGTSEERLGALLTDRDRWTLVTKCGETYEQGRSRFDFSPAAVRASVEQSLRALRTNRLDIVLLHSDGNDRDVLAQGGDTLVRLKEQGLIRAWGLSAKTAEGARAALGVCDVLMLAPDLADVMAEAHAAGVGVLVKKALESGHAHDPGVALRHAAALPGAGCVVVGTLSPDHLRANASALV